MPSRTSPVMHSAGGHDMPPDRFRQGHPPERFHASKPWNVNPEYVPKGRAYFEVCTFSCYKYLRNSEIRWLLFLNKS